MQPRAPVRCLTSTRQPEMGQLMYAYAAASPAGRMRYPTVHCMCARDVCSVAPMGRPKHRKCLRLPHR